MGSRKVWIGDQGKWVSRARKIRMGAVVGLQRREGRPALSAKSMGWGAGKVWLRPRDVGR